jgi:uncharacterized protein YerC
MLASGASYSAVQKATGCSRATVAKIAKRVKASPSEMGPILSPGH